MPWNRALSRELVQCNMIRYGSASRRLLYCYIVSFNLTPMSTIPPPPAPAAWPKSLGTPDVHDHRHVARPQAVRPMRAPSPLASTAAARLAKVAVALLGLWLLVGWALGWWSA